MGAVVGGADAPPAKPFIEGDSRPTRPALLPYQSKGSALPDQTACPTRPPPLTCASNLLGLVGFVFCIAAMGSSHCDLCPTPPRFVQIHI